MSCSSCPAKGLSNNISDSEEISCGKLNTYDWLKNIPDSSDQTDIVEIRFKNTHKDFFLNNKNLTLKSGEYVAVEAERGHDIGQVGLTGRLALMQLKRKNVKEQPQRLIYRKANAIDLEKWQLSRLKEKSVMIRARQIAAGDKLNMKISDVEFQGDGSKAIFYYIADERVDFRELIKKYAAEFQIRIEMRQIGARQEAGMVGGIGSCGKELCCSSWRNNLESVLTTAARIQELPANAQKLTGQCGKLKCCLMYELDTYLEAQNDFPDVLLELETDKGIAYPKKKDLLRKIVFYGYSPDDNSNYFPVSLERVKEIIQLNKKGIKPELSATVVLPDTEKFVTYESDLNKISENRAHKSVKKKIQ
jgi:cell fate regulator YaaT (PSP1 superfamily)